MIDSFEKLSGGNITDVYKQNETVLRKQNDWSSTIHRLLLHLEKEEFKNSPRFIGIDKNEYEILSFMTGECKSDYPFTNDKKNQLLVIGELGKIIRNFHDSTASFEVSKEDKWMLKYNGNLDKEVVCHNDIAPYNMTFINDLPFGMIDFDTCCRAPRVWDIAYALYRFVPFSESIYDVELGEYRSYEEEIDEEYRKEAINVFFDSYGMNFKKDLFIQMELRLTDLAHYIYKEAKKGNEAFKKMYDEGHYDFYLDEIKFIKQNKEKWI